MVKIDGKEIDLSFKEFELLAYFVENQGIALSREKILNNVWNYDYFGDARTIDTHVKKLRSKLGEKDVYKRQDLLKLHIYGYLNKIRSSRALEVEAKRNIELMWLINAITPDHGTIAGFVQKNKAAFHNALRNLTLILKGWRVN